MRISRVSCRAIGRVLEASEKRGQIAGRRSPRWISGGLVALPLILITTINSKAQCGRWLPAAGVAGLTDVPNVAGGAACAIRWDADGTGPVPERLLVGGVFDGAGQTGSSNLAWWDGARWSRFNAGTNNWTRSFQVFEGSLFTTGVAPGGSGQASSYFIKKWNGNVVESSWQILGSEAKLKVVGSDLYAIGAGSIGGVSTPGVARWSGSSWTAASTGSGGYHAIEEYGGELVVAGSFGAISGVSAINIARLSTGEWRPLGAGVGTWSSPPIPVAALTKNNGRLIAGGAFTIAGGVAATNVAAWDGTEWTAMGSGLPNRVTALGTWQGNLVAATQRVTQGSYFARVYAWTGQDWVPITDEFSSSVTAFSEFQGKLVTLGQFNRIGSVFARNIAIYDGTSWSSTWPGAASVPWKMLMDGQTAIVAETAGRVSRWDGRAWSTLGIADGPVSTVGASAIARWQGDIVVGGNFDRMGGVIAQNIARLGPSGWQAMGAGIAGTVSSLVVHNNELYAAADIANPIRRWDGLSWQPVLPATTYMPSDIASWNGELYALGTLFPANNQILHRLNGTWMAVTFPFSTTTSRLVPEQNQLLMCGADFDFGGHNGLLSWNGTSFGSIGGSFTSWGAQDTLLYRGARIAASSSLLKISGSSWSSLGASGYPYCLAVQGPELLVGGTFGNPGGNGSPFFARWTDTGVPWIVEQPESQYLVNNDALTLTAAPAIGYYFAGPLAVQWYRNGLPIANGAGGASPGGGQVFQATSTIVESQYAVLTIQGVRRSDSGAYTVGISNSCGTTTSLAASVSVALCAADFDASGGLSVLDIFGFLDAWLAGNSRADFNGSGGLSAQDIFDYLGAWFSGC